VRNLKTALAGLHVATVRSVMGRIELELRPDSPWEEVRERLARVFGIANFSHANRGPHDFNALSAKILDELGDATPVSFRVSVTRGDKRLPFTSPQAEREIGGTIWDARGWKVDLSHPALTIHIEMLSDGAFYFFDKQPGAGGLPTGTGGRVACLLSGGIDSPVAAWRMMRRGCRTLLVHFHSYPILSRASQDKTRELSALLTRYQYDSRLFLVPFGHIQQRVVLAVQPPLRVVIYRRLMMRIAEQIALQHRAQAIVTGEVVGQVASQTLENLSNIDDVVSMPVLRPLIGFDKDEIMLEAQRLGTYPISIIPDQDCCTLFTPKHPATKARRAEVEAAEQALPVEEIVQQALAETVVESFRFPRQRG
jgi:tRNA uracil 4-sulfurtransferase